MMFRDTGRVIWLCWLLYSFLPFVHCQFGSTAFTGSSFPGSSGRGPIANGFSNAGFGGTAPNRFPQGFGPQRNGRFGGGKFSAPQESQQEAGSKIPQGVNEPNRGEPLSNGLSPTVAPSTAISTPSSVALIVSEPLPPLPTPSPVAGGVGPELANATLPSLPTTTPTRSTPAVERPTRDLATDRRLELISVSSISSIVTPPTTLSTDEVASNLPSAMIVSSTSVPNMTDRIVMTTSPTPVQTSTNTSSVLLATESSVASPALDLAPLSTSTGSAMSNSARAGIGIGVTFGVLSTASVTGFILWRRYRTQRRWRKSGNTGGGFGGFSRFKWTREPKGDAEWEIGNAEKVEILRGASARTVSRSDSSRSIRPGGDAGRKEDVGSKPNLQILKVGMWVPDRPHPALTSNPPIVTPSQFPRPPSGSSGRYMGGGNGKKTSSWPLPE